MMMYRRLLLTTLAAGIIASACGTQTDPSATPLQYTVRITNAAPAAADPNPPATVTSGSRPPLPAAMGPTATLPADRPATASPTPESDPTLAPTRPTGPNDWQKLPVIPVLDDRLIEIYQTGIALGNNPRAFSKIGDCGSTPAWFLGDFDRGPRYFDLGPYTNLQPAIDAFQGSFDRTSLAARSGFNTSALFTPLWSDRSFCLADEAPLACEYRVHRPMIAFIMLGTNDVWRPDEFEPQMRRTIEFSIQNGVIPVLSTKADNVEGNGSINATIARLALEYRVPLWNFWAAVQPLPDHGMQDDGAHLTWGRNRFGDADAMQKAWPVRNLTALQTLNVIWKKLKDL